jgi:hypothetical protein
MADEVQTTVDQGAIVSDFQNEFVSQEAPEIIADPNNGQTMGEPAPQPTAKPAPAAQPVTAQPAAKPIPTAAPAVDELQKPFMGEDGSFSAEKWINHFNAIKRNPVKPVTPTIDTTLAAQPQDNKQPWEKMLEEQESYQTNLTGNLMAWKEQYLIAKQAGYDDVQAQAYADQQVNTWLNKHITRRNAEAQWKAQQEGNTTQQEANEIARLKPIADSHYNLVAAEFGGVEQLEKLLTNKELGGDMTMWLFERDNQGKKFKDQAAVNEAIDNWFIKKIGQNPDDIRRIANYGLSMYRDKYFPKVVEHIKKGQTAAPMARKLATTQTRTVTNTAPKGKPDALDVWGTPPDQREFVKQEG